MRYKKKFGQIIQNFVRHDQNHTSINYTDQALSTMVIHNNEKLLLKKVISGFTSTNRLIAIKQLGRKSNNEITIQILTRISVHEPNLEIRAAATEALNKIKNRTSLLN